MSVGKGGYFATTQNNGIPRKVSASEGFLVISHYVRLTGPLGGAALSLVPPLADIVGDYAGQNGDDKGGYIIHNSHLLPLRRCGSEASIAQLLTKYNNKSCPRCWNTEDGYRAEDRERIVL